MTSLKKLFTPQKARKSNSFSHPAASSHEDESILNVNEFQVQILLLRKAKGREKNVQTFNAIISFVSHAQSFSSLRRFHRRSLENWKTLSKL